MTKLIRALAALRRQAATVLTSAALAAALTAPAVAQNPDALRETHGDWEIRCADSGSCYMVQEKIGPKGQPQMAMMVRKLPTPSADAQPLVAQVEIVVPLGMFILNGIGMGVDTTQIGVMPFERCLSYGCVSRPLLRQDSIANLKSGGEAVFTMWPDPKQAPIEFRMSLSGFTAAYDAL